MSQYTLNIRNEDGLDTGSKCFIDPDLDDLGDSMSLFSELTEFVIDARAYADTYMVILTGPGGQVLLHASQADDWALHFGAPPEVQP